MNKNYSVFILLRRSVTTGKRRIRFQHDARRQYGDHGRRRHRICLRWNSQSRWCPTQSWGGDEVPPTWRVGWGWTNRDCQVARTIHLGPSDSARGQKGHWKPIRVCEQVRRARPTCETKGAAGCTSFRQVEGVDFVGDEISSSVWRAQTIGVVLALVAHLKLMQTMRMFKHLCQKVKKSTSYPQKGSKQMIAQCTSSKKHCTAWNKLARSGMTIDATYWWVWASSQAKVTLV